MLAAPTASLLASMMLDLAQVQITGIQSGLKEDHTLELVDLAARIHALSRKVTTPRLYPSIPINSFQPTPPPSPAKDLHLGRSASPSSTGTLSNNHIDDLSSIFSNLTTPSSSGLSTFDYQDHEAQRRKKWALDRVALFQHGQRLIKECRFDPADTTPLKIVVLVKGKLYDCELSMRVLELNKRDGTPQVRGKFFVEDGSAQSGYYYIHQGGAFWIGIVGNSAEKFGSFV